MNGAPNAHPRHNQSMLILASASPRRRELLAQAGFSFEVHPAHIPEDPLLNEDPISYVTRLAREKAQSVFTELPSQKAPYPPQFVRPGTHPVGGSRPNLVQNEVRALAPEGILKTISPSWAPTPPSPSTIKSSASLKTPPTPPASCACSPAAPIDVITGVALVTAERTQVASEVTAVKFLTLSDEEIAAYIATGEPMDKAGAYAIQGRAARWIPRIEGDYFNVVGLPIALVSTLLEASRF